MNYVIYCIFTLLNRMRVWNVTTGRVLIESVIALDTKLNPAFQLNRELWKFEVFYEF